jgi:hypothetical protein
VESKTTGWIVVGVGAVVSIIGQLMRPSEFGAGVLGFGLAHIILGILDMMRPTVRQGS